MFNIYDPTRFVLVEKKNPYIKGKIFTLRVTQSFIDHVSTHFNCDRISHAD